MIIVLPQICFAVGLSYLAIYLDEKGINPLDQAEPPLAIAILVTFLLVFKTQNSYSQFWQALTHLDGVLHISNVFAHMQHNIMHFLHFPNSE